MHSRTHTTYTRLKKDGTHSFNIPIECIRKTRSLNLDSHSCNVSREVYKIIKSKNGRKLFT